MHRTATTTTTTAGAAGATPVTGDESDDDGRGVQGVKCATDNPSIATQRAARTRRQALARTAAGDTARASPKHTPIFVRFVHLRSGAAGDVSEQQRMQQVAVLNDAFRAANFDFIYHPSNVVNHDNDDWFRMEHKSAEEAAAKRELYRSGFLNIYTVNPPTGTLGWATFPWDFAGAPTMDGVVLHVDTLPGGTNHPFNEGDTGVHEVGHWFGLLHTFQNGCSGEGDEIDDTPAHRFPNWGKPDPTAANGACMAGERAPVKNYMNYTDDAWMDNFTPGQVARMQEHAAVYRRDAGTFFVVNRRSGKMLDVHSHDIDCDGANVQQWGRGGTDQHWRLESIGGGYFHIVNAHSGKLLDVHAPDINRDGANVQQRGCGGTNQHWWIDMTDDGHFYIVNRASGKVIDIDLPEVGLDGANAQQWSRSGGHHQQWTVSSVH
ncbi:unnamed protein product [Vitrella brassicaformis CCMP3155]|uniref:Ricin B lectin domain-containing protein n=2 Tax=Vitrella brassicaformis TaxID=1169539 RepID=A0A0G4GBQ4_VITBC|nr:unnamed protein product [Vitrella brassicaformis CCMP3155]|eukprot:CEM26450.1 unnamed protein product [Vitrella brassicaformis CCMP3155]